LTIVAPSSRHRYSREKLAAEEQKKETKKEGGENSEGCGFLSLSLLSTAIVCVSSTQVRNEGGKGVPEKGEGNWLTF